MTFRDGGGADVAGEGLGFAQLLGQDGVVCELAFLVGLERQGPAKGEHQQGEHDRGYSAALPRRIYPPLFNRYAGGQSFGFHVDNAIRYDRSGPRSEPVRTDLSATLFLSDPADYDGGELVIQDTYGTQRVKLAAGDLVLYPGNSLHEVTPVTRGERTACFFWMQSLVRDPGQRRELFELDRAIQALTLAAPGHAALVQLTGSYHNLLRRWAEC